MNVVYWLCLRSPLILPNLKTSRKCHSTYDSCENITHSMRRPQRWPQRSKRFVFRCSRCSRCSRNSTKPINTNRILSLHRIRVSEETWKLKSCCGHSVVVASIVYRIPMLRCFIRRKNGVELVYINVNFSILLRHAWLEPSAEHDIV